MDPAARTSVQRVLPAAVMLALHAAALAFLTQLPSGTTAEIWGGYHMLGALAEVLALSFGLRGWTAQERIPAVLWVIPLADLVITVGLILYLRPF